MNLSRLTLFKVFLLSALGVLIYANSFSVPFQFDDRIVIVENNGIHYLPDWPATLKAIFDFQPSRAVSLLTLALNYYVHRYDVFGYHCVNVMIHLAAACAAWWFGELLLKLTAFTDDLKKGVGRRRQQKKTEASQLKIEKSSSIDSHDWRAQVPFAAALLFLAHPVNTEAVTYISQRCESLAALFYMLTVCCYLRARMAPRPLLWMGVGLCGVLAMFSKETAITLPLGILLVELFFFRREKIPLQWIAAGLLVLMLVPALFHFDFAMVTNPHPSQSHLGDVLTLPTYLLTQLRVYVAFLKLLFIPVGLNLDHDFVMSHSLFEPHTFLSFVFLAGILGAVLRWRTRYPMIALAVFWFFLTLSSNLVPRAHVMFEHKLYLAAIGTIPALCLGLYDLKKDHRIWGMCFLVVLVIFSVLTVERNKVWRSEISLWQDVIQKSPQKGRSYLSLGAAYAADGQYAKAIETLTKAAGLMADAHVFSTRGAVYVLNKEDDLALKDFNQAIVLDPQMPEPYIGRSELWANRKEYQAAVKDANKAVELLPEKAAGYKIRGRLNETLGRYEAALADYDRSLAIDPGDAQVLGRRGYVYAFQGKADLSRRDFEVALRLDPKFSDGYVYRGMHRKDHGQPQEALADLNKALILKPSSALAFYQRAQLHFQMKNGDEAMKDVNRAIEIDPAYDLAYGLRARLLVDNAKFREAIKDLDESLRLNPKYLDAYLNRGLLRMMVGETQEAVEDFSSAIAINPKSPGAYSRRGKDYANLKEYDSAVADFSKVIELNPAGATDYYNRSLMYKQKGDRTSALPDALKAQELGLGVPAEYLQELQKP